MKMPFRGVASSDNEESAGFLHQPVLAVAPPLSRSRQGGFALNGKH